ncbi:MAG TPA: hypothetical protein DIT48_00130 [Actinobacteria bacterium]|nr:hypothetical protein [Actinomycetota bacterium]HCP62422.1 hypothetical protein [Actinomycetota bacterium]
MSAPFVDRASRFLDRKLSRRTLLSRVAVAGSALAVSPVRYLVKPGTAMEVLTTCSSCASGSACCDGWTAFCCTIHQGANSCPSYAYIGGWWKCTSYTGAGACAKEGVRYYVDCNRRPGSSCPGGCHCAGDNCSNRRTCCNVFRYGQCNTQISGTTEVVCRIIKCVNPCQLYSFCNCTLKVDDATCSHEEPCLQPY